MVQGKEAHIHLINQIELANARNEVDILILGRGGGSLEDLWCFNHEQLARAIHNSDLPIISAVGHEIDTTISDYVADMRAPTPSAAAELVSPNTQELHSKVTQLINRLNNAFKHSIADKRALATQLQHRLNLCHPRNQLNQKAQRLDELSIALQQAMQSRLYQQERTLNNLTPCLMRQSPDKKLAQASHQLSQLQARLNQAIQQQLQQANNSLALQASKLDSVSPLNVLARGYSITKTQQGKVVKSVGQIKAGDVLVTELVDGSVKSTVL
tara:strand:- start:14 stop:823 length:810 start_codon:yes stop_codon:yes gene_type:complete